MWQYTIFHVENAKVCHGNNNFCETSRGVSTRQDVKFPQDMTFLQGMTSDLHT